LRQQTFGVRNKKMMARSDEEFESVVRTHQAMLFRIAFNFFLSAQVAEEVVQDVFLQCFENRANIESGSHLKAWLRRAATHRCIDIVRSGAARKEIQMDELPELADVGSDDDPFIRDRLRRLVASLPEKQRMIVILRYAEDLDSDEIGAILGVPASTVRSHLQRALEILREKAPRIFGDGVYGHIRRHSS
jgi:RNA polymerase sigma-70 factor (ECF subfamily)